MRTLYVARHGETDWNAEGRYQGRKESRLTPRGESQANALALTLYASPDRPERVVTSPLLRTMHTAHPIAERLALPLETDDRLIEIAHGNWEGRLKHEIERDDPELMRIWHEKPEHAQFQGGESLGDVSVRWKSFTESLATEGPAIVVITHDAVVRVAILTARGQSFANFWHPRVINGAYATFSVTENGLELVDECSDGHLKGIIADTAIQAL